MSTNTTFLEREIQDDQDQDQDNRPSGLLRLREVLLVNAVCECGGGGVVHQLEDVEPGHLGGVQQGAALRVSEVGRTGQDHVVYLEEGKDEKYKWQAPIDLLHLVKFWLIKYSLRYKWFHTWDPRALKPISLSLVSRAAESCSADSWRSLPPYDRG